MEDFAGADPGGTPKLHKERKKRCACERELGSILVQHGQQLRRNPFNIEDCA